MVAPAPARKARKELSADSLFQLIRSRFDAIPDTRAGGPQISAHSGFGREGGPEGLHDFIETQTVPRP